MFGNRRLADDLQAAVVVAVLICRCNEFIDSILIENIMAVHALNNGAGSLALSEAGMEMPLLFFLNA